MGNFMKDGKYEVIKPIDTFSCVHGHLRISVGAQIIIDDGIAIAANSVRFPRILLNSVQDCIKRID